MGDCRTCRHNVYKNQPDWVMCGHPTTLRKMPQPEAGDPAWVDMMTGDMRVSRIDDIPPNCPTYEARENTSTEVV